MLPVSANYTVDAIGMIAVMTSWLSKAFRAVFLKVHFAMGHNRGFFDSDFVFFVYIQLSVCTHICLNYCL